MPVHSLRVLDLSTENARTKIVGKRNQTAYSCAHFLSTSTKGKEGMLCKMGNYGKTLQTNNWKIESTNFPRKNELFYSKRFWRNRKEPKILLICSSFQLDCSETVPYWLNAFSVRARSISQTKQLNIIICSIGVPLSQLSFLELHWMNGLIMMSPK